MSTKSSFAEQFGQRVRTRAVVPVTSGSRADLNLAPRKGFTATVPVARALIRRGVKPSVAKSVVERLADGQAAMVSVKHFDQTELTQELGSLDVSVSAQDQDVKALAQALTKAREALKMSQDQFANTLGLRVGTLRNWEQARSKLDAPTELLVRMVASAPDFAVEVASARNGMIKAKTKPARTRKVVSARTSASRSGG